VICLNGDSFAANARLVTGHYDLEVSAWTIKNHSVNHAMKDRTRQLGLLLREVDDQDGPILTAQGIMKLLLSEALQKVVSGTVSVRNMDDVLRILSIAASLDRRQVMDAASSAQAPEDAEAFRQLSLIIQALHEKLPPEHFRNAMDRAVRSGLDESLLSGVNT
jgi:hypothetical protein